MKIVTKLILATAITTLIACGGAEERKAVYLEKARTSIAAGDLDKARIELKNVLQIDPKDAEAYYQLGKVFEELKEYQKAYRNYMKAVDLSPELMTAQARLGRLLLLLANDKEKAQQKIDFILSKEPDNPDGLVLKALLLLKEENKDGAINIIEGVVSREPANTEAVSLLSRLYLGEGEARKAIDVLEKALSISPENKQLNSLLAAVFIENKDFKKAERIYQDFLQNDPDSAAAYNSLAALYHKKGDTAKAEETLRESIENDADDFVRIITLLKYIRETKGVDAAISELQVQIEKNKSIGELRLALAKLYQDNNNKDLAIKTYQQAANEFSEEVTGVNARIALAMIYLDDNDYKKAAEIITEAASVSPNDPSVNMVKARIAVHNEDIEQAILSLRVVTKEMPENVDAYLLLANAYLAENNEEQARATMINAFENNRMNPDGLMKLAKYQMTRDPSQVEKIIDAFNKVRDSDYEGLSMKAAILNQKKAHAEAFKLAEKLIDLYSDKPNGYLQAIPYYLEKRDIQQAITLLEQGYEKTAHNRKILTLLTTIQGANKQFDVVEKRIQTELEKTPDDDELKVLLYKVYMARNATDLAEPLLTDIINNDTRLEDPYFWQAQVYFSKNDKAAAEAVLKKGMKNVPGSLKIPLRLAALYEIDKRYQQAIDVYRDLYRSHPDNPLVANNLVSLLSDYGDSKALEEAKQVSARLEGNEQPAFLDTLGWLYYRLGDNEAAIKSLSVAVEKAPDVPVFNYHLGMAYKQAGDSARARTYLEKSLAGDKDFSEKEQAQAALKEL